ncbi:MAG: putative phage abortive infection protein [Muricauda sp.]|nr:putative phage abortive infection protein [Allomuricauda sp.]MBA4743961.1 putative phage abortive infection protein [Allomuricauda sp.]
MSSSNTNDDSIKSYQSQIKRLSWVLGIVAAILILISFLAPWILTNNKFSIIDFTDTGGIGDTIGGIMNPFIGLAGIILTFLAFYLQYKANQIQIANFDRQLKQDRLHFENQLKEQKEQFLKNQIENQFIEMIRLHKENVSEMSLEIFTSITNNKETINGRKVFKHFLNEVNIIYEVIKKHFTEEDADFRIRLSYDYFFSGLSHVYLLNPPKSDLHQQAFRDFKNINSSFLSTPGVDGGVKIRDIVSDPRLNLNHLILSGHSNLLGHYYRHLFHSVKFIVNLNENAFPYEEKRKYLRLLRAQLSNEEQALLFYNWRSGYGTDWESQSNRFFTDFRMIHNLRPMQLHYDFDLAKEFNLNSGYRTEKGRNDDFLFEFQVRRNEI